MSVFFKRQPKIAFGSQEEVTAYWKREGAHRLSREQIEDMLRLMIDDVTFRITTDFFAGRLGAALGGRLLDAGCGWGRSLFGLKRRFACV